MNSLDKMEDYDRFARLCEAKDAEIEIMKAESSISDQLLSEANAMIAMQTEALKESVGLIDVDTVVAFYEEYKLILGALSATSETVAAWRAKETEPLRREVAMLRVELEKALDDDPCGPDCKCSGCIALSDTQATALAYEREVKAKEEAAKKFMFGVAHELRVLANELRASKGE